MSQITYFVLFFSTSGILSAFLLSCVIFDRIPSHIIVAFDPMHSYIVSRKMEILEWHPPKEKMLWQIQVVKSWHTLSDDTSNRNLPMPVQGCSHRTSLQPRMNTICRNLALLFSIVSLRVVRRGILTGGIFPKTLLVGLASVMNR